MLRLGLHVFDVRLDMYHAEIQLVISTTLLKSVSIKYKQA